MNDAMQWFTCDDQLILGIEGPEGKVEIIYQVTVPPGWSGEAWTDVRTDSAGTTWEFTPSFKDGDRIARKESNLLSEKHPFINEDDQVAWLAIRLAGERIRGKLSVELVSAPRPMVGRSRNRACSARRAVLEAESVSDCGQKRRG